MRIGERTIFTAVVAVLIALNLLTLLQAYPETSRIDSGCCAQADQMLAKDFSAFYTAVWRLFHDPAQIYTHGFVPDGEYYVLPQPESFKYLPSFLVMVSPVALLPYQSALIAFDAFQFLLLPLMALMIYRITGARSLRTRIILAVVVLLLPIPLYFGEWSVSASYYWQWAEGQPKVLDAFLLVLMTYLGRIGKPRLSGIAFGLALFDPRFGLLALPVFVAYNIVALRSSSFYALGTILVTNLPLFYPGVGQGFIGMALSSGLSTPLYYYSWIPLVTVVSLIIVGRKEIVLALTRITSGDRISRSQRLSKWTYTFVNSFQQNRWSSAVSVSDLITAVNQSTAESNSHVIQHRYTELEAVAGRANSKNATDSSSQHTCTIPRMILKSGKRLPGLNRHFPPGRPWVRKGRKSLRRTSERF